mmetsp:Transcript_20477/g.23202  ORF Transcript_20477/g.23202 Transcript_20477/m.23202 type:complete len:268 (+) Transcript_20477:49-852(+)
MEAKTKFPVADPEKIPLEEFSVDSTIPKPENHIRIVVISDTHAQATKLDIPEGDILIHAGDFTNRGTSKEVKGFKKFLTSCSHPQKIVIAGNHDRCFEPEYYQASHKDAPNPESFTIEKALQTKSLIESSCTYLEDSSVELYGYKFYGTPWVPYIWGAFNLKTEGQLAEKWEKIPADCDILITHGPPHGIGDQTTRGMSVGSRSLAKKLLFEGENNIKYHIFGHIHESRGIYQVGEKTFINAASLNHPSRDLRGPIVFDLPIRCQAE